MKTISLSSISVGLAAALMATTTFAHGDHDPTQGHEKPPPLAVLQLDQVRDADRALRRRGDGRGRRLSRHRPVRAEHGLALHEGDAGRRTLRPDEPGAARVRRRSVRRQTQTGCRRIRGAAGALEARAAGSSAARMSGMRISSSSCGRCTRGCSNSTRWRVRAVQSAIALTTARSQCHLTDAALWVAFQERPLITPGRRWNPWACGSTRSRRRAAR